MTLPFHEPLVLKPGESCGLYVHSSAMGDEAIAYDDYDNRRDIPREVPRSLPCGARTPSQPINQRTLAPQPTPKEGQEAETRDTRQSTGQFSAPGQRGGQGCIGRGGAPPPLSRAPSLCPATVSLNATARLNGVCNRRTCRTWMEENSEHCPLEQIGNEGRVQACEAGWGKWLGLAPVPFLSCPAGGFDASAVGQVLAPFGRGGGGCLRNRSGSPSGADQP